MTIDYKALAGRIDREAARMASNAALYREIGNEKAAKHIDPLVADLRTLVSLLDGMADAKPFLWVDALDETEFPAVARDPLKLVGDTVPLFLRPERSAPQPQPAQPPDGAPYGIIDPDYGRVYTIARKLAWEEGYAIGLHGSFTRDLDMIAVPWTDTACEPEHLIRRIADAADLKIRDGVGIKPHGRLAWTLFFPAFGDPRFVDLSIMPRVLSDSQPERQPVNEQLAHEIWSSAQLAPGEGIEDGVERIAALLGGAVSEPTEAQIEAAEAKPVAWIDEFGNAFPLDAWKPAKRTYLDDHKMGWKPLFTHPAPQPQPNPAMLESHRRWVEQAIHDAEHPSGMSTHDGKARIDASVLRRMLAIIDAPQPQPVLSGYGDYGAAIPGIERPCTCHPDDNPPVLCARQYALNECRAVSGEPTEAQIHAAIVEMLPLSNERVNPEFLRSLVKRALRAALAAKDK